MPPLTVALLQLPSHGADPARALHDGERACREAAALGSDVALFPEMWQIGYTLPAPEALATPTDGPFVGRFRALARELGMAIVITYLQRWDGPPRNAATVIDRHGDIVFTYAKVHTCDFGPEDEMTAGEHFRVGELDTAAGPVRVGVMICFDREFPESARLLMLGGAEIILTPNACVIDEERRGQFRVRAFENMVGVAMANYPAPVPNGEYCNGHSIAFDGVCYEPDGTPRDHKLVEAGHEERVFLAAFDLDEMRAYREREPWGGAYRKPAAYAALATREPAPLRRP
jgi:N-carbamoylputrescine amidase